MSATTAWGLIAALVLTTVAIKAAGPVAMGGRTLPPRLIGTITLLPSALLAALVVTGTFTDGHGGLRVGAEAAGVLTAGGITLRGGSVLVAVVAAAGVTAVLRALGT